LKSPVVDISVSVGNSTLPASIQWQIVKEAAEAIEPAWGGLVREAAQGEVLHNDDTTAVILETIRERRKREQAEEAGEASEPRERTGTFTAGIVSVVGERRIALFFTGHQHAGENLRDVLLKRAAGLAAPIQMCDGLARNEPALPEELRVILSNCNARARRQYVDVASRFPVECRTCSKFFATFIVTKVWRGVGRCRLRSGWHSTGLRALRGWRI